MSKLISITDANYVKVKARSEQTRRPMSEIMADGLQALETVEYVRKFQNTEDKDRAIMELTIRVKELEGQKQGQAEQGQIITAIVELLNKRNFK